MSALRSGRDDRLDTAAGGGRRRRKAEEIMKERIWLGRTGTEEEVGWDNEGGRRTGKGKGKMN